MVDGLAALVWLANQGVVELHPFLWRIDAPRVPTEIVFDLDPGLPAGLVDCARVALALRDAALDRLGFEPLVKTSGSLGLHVHAPLTEPLDTKGLARSVAEHLANARPAEVVREVRRSARAGRVYIDWLQNDPKRQTVAPYSLRGVPAPAVAAPLTWEEVEGAAHTADAAALVVAPADLPERLERHGDLFGALLRPLP
jgi:bifunctional non-homologous end joining protein LigD